MHTAAAGHGRTAGDTRGAIFSKGDKLPAPFVGPVTGSLEKSCFDEPCEYKIGDRGE